MQATVDPCYEYQIQTSSTCIIIEMPNKEFQHFKMHLMYIYTHVHQKINKIFTYRHDNRISF